MPATSCTRVRGGCALDRPALKALPLEPYEFANWKTARVNIDYHVEIERHYYSVPYQLVGRQVEIRLADRTVEIFHRGQRVASHMRSREPYHLNYALNT